MTAKPAPTKLWRYLVVLALVAVAALLIARWSDSGSGGATGREVGATSDVIVKSRDAITATENEIASGQYPNGHDTDEESVTGSSPVKPCSLVSQAQADHILGDGATISEHLQGPTCAFSGSGREVTLVLMEAPIKPLVAGARSAQPLQIAGHQAWCVRYETTSIVTAVGGEVLEVSGACPAAARFARAALAWL